MERKLVSASSAIWTANATHNASQANPKCGTAPLATGQPNYSEHETDRRDGLPDPEQEHPLDDPGLERGHAGFQTTLERFELGVESPEIQLVELTQLGSVRGVHPIEPVDQLVGDVIAKLLVEPLGQSCRHRHRALSSRVRQQPKPMLGAGDRQSAASGVVFARR